MPIMENFAALWFNENKVQSRERYIDSVTNIVEGRIIHFFNSIPIDQITKQQVLEFRTHICKLQKKEWRSFVTLTY